MSITESLLFYPNCGQNKSESTKIYLFSTLHNIKLTIKTDPTPFGFTQPVLIDSANNDTLIIGANSICKYILALSTTQSSSSGGLDSVTSELLDYEETTLKKYLQSSSQVLYYLSINSISVIFSLRYYAFYT